MYQPYTESYWDIMPKARHSRATQADTSVRRFTRVRILWARGMVSAMVRVMMDMYSWKSARANPSSSQTGWMNTPPQLEKMPISPSWISPHAAITSHP